MEKAHRRGLRKARQEGAESIADINFSQLYTLALMGRILSSSVEVITPIIPLIARGIIGV